MQVACPPGVSSILAKYRDGFRRVRGLRLFVAAAPLFEEEGAVVFFALVADRRHPLLLHRSGTDAALAADNHPVDSFEVESNSISTSARSVISSLQWFAWSAPASLPRVLTNAPT